MEVIMIKKNSNNVEKKKDKQIDGSYVNGVFEDGIRKIDGSRK